jgi:hypothetical protein
MTTGIFTVTLNEMEIRVLVEALKHHAFVHQRWLLNSGREARESIEGILDMCSMILRLRDLSGNCDENFNLPPMIFCDSETGVVKRAIELYGAFCERVGRTGKECIQCELPYGELPALMTGILPRLEQNWTQTSGHIPSDIPGEPGTIWVR